VGNIGVFDSGVGGLTVVSAVRRALPGRDLIYLGDTARLPYGTKSPRTVERYSLACLQFLLRHRVELVMVACNTASANALPALQSSCPVPVIGAVSPGAQSGVRITRNGHIGVLGTHATVTSGAYVDELRALDASTTVTAVACPLFVPLAEEGWTDDDIARAIIRRYLLDLFRRDPRIDTIILGCTHYPLLRRALTDVAAEIAGHSVAVVDSSGAMADAAYELLGPGPATNGKLQLFATDMSRLHDLAHRFLGYDSPISFEVVDL